MKATRGSVRRLVARGVLGLVERNCRSQHVVRVRLPLEVKGLRATRKTSLPPAHPVFAKIEEADFMEKQVLRLSLHEREGGHCFYCLRRSPGDRKLSGRLRALDALAAGKLIPPVPGQG